MYLLDETERAQGFSCPRCDFENRPGAQVCGRCGLRFTAFLRLKNGVRSRGVAPLDIVREADEEPDAPMDEPEAVDPAEPEATEPVLETPARRAGRAKPKAPRPNSQGKSQPRSQVLARTRAKVRA